VFGLLNCQQARANMPIRSDNRRQIVANERSREADAFMSGIVLVVARNAERFFGILSLKKEGEKP
jgi:hypothetical protein